MVSKSAKFSIFTKTQTNFSFFYPYMQKNLFLPIFGEKPPNQASFNKKGFELVRGSEFKIWNQVMEEVI